MAIVRVFTAFLLCAGLGLPGSHGVALCIDHDGDVAVEAAINGACVGSRIGECCDGEPDESPENLACGESDHCGGCRDVVLGAGDVLTLPPTTGDTQLLGKVRVDAAVTSADLPEPTAAPCASTCTAPPPVVNPPPPGGSAVLLL